MFYNMKESIEGLFQAGSKDVAFVHDLKWYIWENDWFSHKMLLSRPVGQKEVCTIVAAYKDLEVWKLGTEDPFQTTGLSQYGVTEENQFGLTPACLRGLVPTQPHMIPDAVDIIASELRLTTKKKKVPMPMAEPQRGPGQSPSRCLGGGGGAPAIFL